MGGVCVSDTGECVSGMGDLISETGELACDMEVIACPNCDQLEKGNSLAPPTAQTLASKARTSDSDMPIAVVNVAWVSPLSGSSVEGGTFPDSVMSEVVDKPVCVLGLSEEEEED